ncbi:MAG: hypothetical protein ACHQNE_03710 [Candidatus Kapaibacterium sp.]
MKRNYISEIQEIKKRSVSHRRVAARKRLDAIKETWTHHKLHDDVFGYFPIALITVIVSNCRLVAADLVDNSDAFLENAVRELEIKIDATIMRAIKGDEVSVGDLVGHTLKLNDLNDINGALSKIIGQDFFELLKQRIESKTRTKNIEWSSLYVTLRRLFELRHIAAHELSDLVIDAGFVEKSIEYVSALIDEIEYVALDVLYPNSPMTQAEMNQVAHNSLLETKDKYETLLSIIESHLGSEWLDFKPEIDAFYQACEIGAKSFSDPYMGGTIQPLMYDSHFEGLLKHEIKRLKLLLRARTEGW